MKIGKSMDSLARIADAFDRLVSLAEDWSEALGLPRNPVGSLIPEEEEEER